VADPLFDLDANQVQLAVSTEQRIMESLTDVKNRIDPALFTRLIDKLRADIIALVGS
jgi:hypothetical protein